MNKHEIVNALNDVLTIHDNWANQRSLIADAINLDGLIEPVDYEETDLQIWLKANKSSISAFSWYKELQQSHVKAHYSYSDLFENATRKYNPKTRDDLLQEFELVTKDISELKHTIEKIEKDITEMSDILYLDFVLKSNAINRKNELESTNDNNELDTQEDHNEAMTVDSVDNKNETITEVDDIESNDSVEDNTKKLDEANELVSEEDVKTIINDEFTETNAEFKENDSNDENNSNDVSDSNEMQKIDINEFEKINKVKTQLEIDSKTMLLGKKLEQASEKSNLETSTSNESPAINSAKLKSDYESIKSNFNAKDNLQRHIELKEQNLKRLQSEKELFEQELNHLEETQKLSQQGINQLEQHLSLKQEEVELEQLDNEKLLEVNSHERDQKIQQLEIIEKQKVELKNEIIELEQENIKDELVQEDIKKKPSIEKQFDAVKSNKVNELDSLKTLLNDKNNALIKLKEQVLALADEVADIEDDIEMKQQSIDDLEEKEKSKNEERALKLEANASIIYERNQTINSHNDKLDVLTQDASNAQKELNELIINLEKVKKTISSIEDINDSEIEEIEAQQLERQNKLTEVYNQKVSKQSEIDEIQKRIDEAESTLKELKSELTEEKDQNQEKQLEAVN